MPAGLLERGSPSAAAATAAAGRSTPEKGRSAPDSRRSSKPIMEKRRRARINESLAQLKTLILDALKKDSSRHSKLEKADILEMTVRHLKNLQRLQMTAAVTSDPSVLGKYRAGFSECVGEVTRFLSTCEGVSAEVRTRLLGHLASCVGQTGTLGFYGPPPASLGHAPNTAIATASAARAPCKSGGSSAPPLSPEAVTLYGGFQVVPSADGHLTFFVPGAALAPLSARGGRHLCPAAPPLTLDSVWRPW